MGERKFNVGDKVNVRGHGEGVIKFIDNDSLPYAVELKQGGYHNCAGYCKVGRGYWAQEDQLELISSTDKPDWKVLIIPDGDKTLGRLYENGKVVKSVETKKHPDDEYSAEIATKTIMERLFPNPKYHIEPYLGIWCETKEECETLKRELDKRGYKWKGDSSLITGIDFHEPKCRYHLREDKRVTATKDKDYKHILDGKPFTDIDFKDLSFDDLVEPKKEEVKPKEPEFKVGDVIALEDDFCSVPRGTRGVVVGIDYDSDLVVDFKMEYGGTHPCSSYLTRVGQKPLSEPTGLYVRPHYAKKVN